MHASIINYGIKHYLAYRHRRIRAMHTDAPALQDQLLRTLLNKGADTAYAKDYGLSRQTTYKAFAEMLPVVEYETIYPYIDRCLRGEADVLAPGHIRYFAKSSGTSNDRSKYLPVTEEMISDNFICSSWDAMAMVYHAMPDARIFADKSLLVGGTLQPYVHNPNVTIGDVSAIMINEMPGIGRPFYTPDFDTAMLDDFDLKLRRMVEITSTEPVTMFGGVPTWLIVLMKRMLDHTGKEHMGQVWPQARLYMHGGVGFGPYRDQFEELFPAQQLTYMNVYNASEGYIGLQDSFDQDSLLLMVDNGIYYEFVTMEDYHQQRYDRCLPLEGVKVGTEYVLIMSTCAGLWRYVPGDTVRFVSTAPYRLQVSGRTSQYLNVFGEEVMVSNTDRAISEICAVTGSKIVDYTVAPIHLTNTHQGCHHWLIEWAIMPGDLDLFADMLDDRLRLINSDYDAKRAGDMALRRLQLDTLPSGAFRSWLKARGKAGSQVKVPRLSNDRSIVTELLAYNSQRR